MSKRGARSGYRGVYYDHDSAIYIKMRRGGMSVYGFNTVKEAARMWKRVKEGELTIVQAAEETKPVRDEHLAERAANATAAHVARAAKAKLEKRSDKIAAKMAVLQAELDDVSEKLMEAHIGGPSGA